MEALTCSAGASSGELDDLALLNIVFDFEEAKRRFFSIGLFSSFEPVGADLLFRCFRNLDIQDSYDGWLVERREQCKVSCSRS